MKYLEDFHRGQIYRFRAEPLNKEEIVAFAQEWDPQRLNTMRTMPWPSNAVALDVEDHAALYARFADQLRQGETLGADVSMLKIWVTETFQKITELMIEAAGPDGGTLGPLQVGNVGVDILASFYKARPTTIYGGSNEIQRNILSKAVLRLPG